MFWQTPETFDDGEALFEAVCAHELEGVVAKRRTGRYRPSERGWVKIKNRGYWRWEMERESAIDSRRPRSRYRRRERRVVSHRVGHVVAPDRCRRKGIGLSAVHRHPRRLAGRGLHFRADALRGRHALSRLTVSTTRGRSAKRLALGAFANYAAVGKLWALAGRARVAHSACATKDAQLAATHAGRAATLLIRAGALLH